MLISDNSDKSRGSRDNDKEDPVRNQGLVTGRARTGWELVASSVSAFSAAVLHDVVALGNILYVALSGMGTPG